MYLITKIKKFQCRNHKTFIWEYSKLLLINQAQITKMDHVIKSALLPGVLFIVTNETTRRLTFLALYRTFFKTKRWRQQKSWCIGLKKQTGLLFRNQHLETMFYRDNGPSQNTKGNGTLLWLQQVSIIANLPCHVGKKHTAFLFDPTIVSKRAPAITYATYV